MYRTLRKEYQEKGDAEALAKAHALVESNARLTVADRDRLFGYLEGTGIAILPEPEVLLTATPKVPGSTGARCRSPTAIRSGCAKSRIRSSRSSRPCKPIRRAYVAPIRAIPDKCPVWDLHKVYSNADTQAWVQHGCRTAGIGCLECKAPLIEKIVEEIAGDFASGRRSSRRILSWYAVSSLKDASGRARRRATRWMRFVKPWR